MPASSLDLVTLEKNAPELVSLAKSAAAILNKRELSKHSAKVALCLDISLSMNSLYKSGAIAKLVERVLALGLNLDDDGSIDVFLFGKESHFLGEIGPCNHSSTTRDILERFPLEPGTNYGKVIQRIRQHYADEQNLPVYVMFITDGDTSDKDFATKQIREASSERLFWQFMAIGKPGKGLLGRLMGSDFTFLEKLDRMSGRVVDNANFFCLENPNSPTDRELFELLMQEYPAWLLAAQQQSII